MNGGDRAVAWRTVAPLLALMALMGLWAGGALFVIAREADRSDAVRAREAVSRTFTAMEQRVNQSAQINGIDVAVARSVAKLPGDPREALSDFSFSWPDTIGYYGMIVLDEAGAPVLGTYAGRPWTGPDYRATAAVARRVADTLKPGEIVAHWKLVRGPGGGPAVVAASNILPKPGDVAPDLAAAPRRRLVMIQPVDKLLARMAPLVGAEDFRIVDRGDGPNMLALPTDNGAPLIFAWKPRTPGRAAVLRWAPAMLVALLLAAVLLGIAMRSSLATTRSLQRLAGCDPLTGLPNRTRLMALLERGLARGGVVLGLLDLNDFKAVNDTYGHLAGDDLLRAFAAELIAAAPPGVFAARLGGDEFAFLAPTADAAEAFRAVLMARLETPLQAGLLRLRVACGIGIATARPGMTARDLIALADARLYRSKDVPDPGAGSAGSPLLAIAAPLPHIGRGSRAGRVLANPVRSGRKQP